jgi:transcriptional regulator with XRE-family HTH domain
MADPAIVKKICKGIKQMRLNKNITQDQLAASSGVSRITISRLESGQAPNLITLVQLLRALDKLPLLDAFREEPLISPMQLLREQQLYRKYASSKRKKSNAAPIEESEW